MPDTDMPPHTRASREQAPHPPSRYGADSARGADAAHEVARPVTVAYDGTGLPRGIVVPHDVDARPHDVQGPPGEPDAPRTQTRLP